MLVLTRRPGERLYIANGEIVLTVLAVNGDKVRLGIAAPARVQIHREEVWLRTHDEPAACIQQPVG
jgi:carbon storage regulator